MSPDWAPAGPATLEAASAMAMQVERLSRFVMDRNAATP
jgi:hypothetical protein